jgi:hypothetical protein
MNLTELKEVFPVVTTIAAVIAAVGATVAAVFSALAHRRESAKGRTVIEAQPLWHPRGLPVLPITVRNLGNETLAIATAEIHRPKGAKITVDSQGLYGLTPAFDPPERQRLEINLVAFSITRTNGGSPLSVLNEAVIPLYFQPPQGWDGGWIKVRIAVSSLASDAKPRWIIVKRYLHKQSVLTERADDRRPQNAAVTWDTPVVSV